MLTLGGDLNIYHFDQVPRHFQELFIHSGYRSPQSTITQCISSVFLGTNETLNFWTHFLPAIYFLYKLGDAIFNYSLDDTYMWPYYLYLSSCFIYLLSSSVAHTFNVLSDRARHVCFFFDYTSVAMYSFFVGVAYRCYCFPDELLNTKLADWFIHIAAFNAIGGGLMACQTRFLPVSMPRKLIRMLPFSLSCVFDVTPILYRMYHYDSTHSDQDDAIIYHFLQLIFCILCVFFYASHLPERLWPGRFDIIGQSHQLFHIFTALASYHQMQGILLDMEEQKLHLNTRPPINSIFVLAMSLTVCLVSLISVYYFTKKIDYIGVEKMQQIVNGKKN